MYPLPGFPSDNILYNSSPVTSSQEIDIIHRSHLGFASFTCSQVCVHTVLRGMQVAWVACPTCHDLSAFTVCGIYPCTSVYN